MVLADSGGQMYAHAARDLRMQPSGNGFWDLVEGLTYRVEDYRRGGSKAGITTPARDRLDVGYV